MHINWLCVGAQISVYFKPSEPPVADSTRWKSMNSNLKTIIRNQRRGLNFRLRKLMFTLFLYTVKKSGVRSGLSRVRPCAKTNVFLLVFTLVAIHQRKKVKPLSSESLQRENLPHSTAATLPVQQNLAIMLCYIATIDLNTWTDFSRKSDLLSNIIISLYTKLMPFLKRMIKLLLISSSFFWLACKLTSHWLLSEVSKLSFQTWIQLYRYRTSLAFVG